MMKRNTRLLLQKQQRRLYLWAIISVCFCCIDVCNAGANVHLFLPLDSLFSALFFFASDGSENFDVTEDARLTAITAITDDDFTNAWIEANCLPQGSSGSGNGNGNDNNGNENNGQRDLALLNNPLFGRVDDPESMIPSDWLESLEESLLETDMYYQLYTLTKFYYATRTDTASPNNVPLDREGWLESCNPCDWGGVSCTLNNVWEMLLEREGIGGTLPAELAGLPYLTRLNLKDNSIGGTLPDNFGKISIYLDLSDNQFLGPLPTDLTGNSLLQLDVSNNALTGYLSDPLVSQLTRIESLDLSENYFTGMFPQTGFNDLADLSTLRMHDNLITGTVPFALCHFTNFDEFTTDCREGILLGPPEVECACCTDCY